jgi:DNA-binding CsgD family transcriptional regulator
MLAVADQEVALEVFDSCLALAHKQGSVFAFAAAKLFGRGRSSFAVRSWMRRPMRARRSRRSSRGTCGSGFRSRRASSPTRSWSRESATAPPRRSNEPASASSCRTASSSSGTSTAGRGFTCSKETSAEGSPETLDLGRRYERVGGRNPAFIPWRSQAALALLALDRRDEALGLADDEVELARQWGAPTSLGRAIRVAGLVEGGAAGLTLLRDAVDIIEGSPARLEQARALVDLGAATRRANRRTESREFLRRGLELATVCGASPLAETARTELLATGARPRRIALSGVDSLTPSERRVAAMAAEGMTNREIAQSLFVTPKTVEVHLSAVYRKLGIASRSKLATALAAEPNASISATAV